jgi:hypothetical protein
MGLIPWVIRFLHLEGREQRWAYMRARARREQGRDVERERDVERDREVGEGGG